MRIRRIDWSDICYKLAVGALIFVPVVTFTSLWNSQREADNAYAASGYTVLASSNDYSKGTPSLMARQIALKDYYGYRSVNGWPSGAACGRAYMSAPWLANSNNIATGGNCNVDQTDGGGSGFGVWMPASWFAGWALPGGSPSGFGSASIYPNPSTFDCSAIPGGSAAFIWGAGGPDTSDQAYGAGGLMVVNKGSSSGGGYHLYSNGTTLFRATFNISASDWAKPGSINLYSVADDWFNLYVNGTLVRQTINSKDPINDDLRPYLHIGQNVMAMQVSDKAVWKLTDSAGSRQSGICYNLAIGPSAGGGALSINANPKVITPPSTSVTATASSGLDYSGLIISSGGYDTKVSSSPIWNGKTIKNVYQWSNPGHNTRLSITRFIVPPNTGLPSGGSGSGSSMDPTCSNYSYGGSSCQANIASRDGESGTLSTTESWNYDDARFEPGTKVCYIAAASYRNYTENPKVVTTYVDHSGDKWIPPRTDHSRDVWVPASTDHSRDYKNANGTTNHSRDTTIPAHWDHSRDTTIPGYTDHSRDYTVTVNTFKRVDGSTWNYQYSAPSCSTVVQIPFTHVTGNDLRVGSAINASSNPSSSQVRGYILRLGGSSSEYGILASGAVSGVGSSSGGFIGSSSSGNSLTFANSGSLGSFTSGAGMGSVPDVSTYSNNNLKNVTKINVGGGNLSSIMSGYNLSNFSGSVVLKVNGSVTVDQNVVYATTPSAGSIPQQLVIIASGNINISSNVGRVDAWLVAMSGSVDTCSDYGWSSLRISNCNTPLSVNGPIMSKQLLLKRTYFNRNSSVSAETLDLRGDAYVWANQVSRANGDWLTTYTTDLPPRF